MSSATAQLRSRVPLKWHARFCSGGGRSDSLAYRNRPFRRGGDVAAEVVRDAE